MKPPELRRLAERLDRAGHAELARAVRNRAARKELGIDPRSRGAAGESALVSGPLTNSGGKKYRGKAT